MSIRKEYRPAAARLPFVATPEMVEAGAAVL